MSSLPIPSAQTLKRWIDYWRKFKGKNVKIFLRSGFKTTANSQIVDSDKSVLGSTLEEQCPDTFTGIISDVVESPFGLWLKNVTLPEREIVEGVFIPMSEILKIYSYKKENGKT